MVWTLLASGEPRLAAAAPFYGPLPDGADFAGSPNAAVIGVYAEQDDRVNASRDAPRSGIGEKRPDPRDRDLPGRGPCVLQRHRTAVQPHRGGVAYQQLIGWFGTHLT
jgi:carboxymethylenebutenolidase